MNVWFISSKMIHTLLINHPYFTTNMPQVVQQPEHLNWNYCIFWSSVPEAGGSCWCIWDVWVLWRWGMGCLGGWPGSHLSQALFLCLPALRSSKFQLCSRLWRQDWSKTYFLSLLKYSRLLCLRNTGLPAWLAPISLQPRLEWQSDSCMSRNWRCLRNVQHSQEDCECHFLEKLLVNHQSLNLILGVKLIMNSWKTYGINSAYWSVLISWLDIVKSFQLLSIPQQGMWKKEETPGLRETRSGQARSNVPVLAVYPPCMTSCLFLRPALEHVQVGKGHHQ